ncbi:MAG: hypothetical protein U9O98_09170 [Asgard group archaeon]|nr:hypothetical protein [Asgard group archaeon]
MAAYNYKWNTKKQKKVVEKSLLQYIRKIVSQYSPFYRRYFEEKELVDLPFKQIDDFLKIPPISEKDYLKEPNSFILYPRDSDWRRDEVRPTKDIPFLQKVKYWLQTLSKTYFRSIFGPIPLSSNERIGIEQANEWLPVHFQTYKKQQSPPAIIAYTKRDLIRNIPEIIAQLYTTGFNPAWELLNLLPAAPDFAFFLSIWAPIFIGGGNFLSFGGDGVSLEEQFDLLETISFEGLIGQPSTLINWIPKITENFKVGKESPLTNLQLCFLLDKNNTNIEKKTIRELFQKIDAAPKLLKILSSNIIRGTFFECSENSGIHLNPRFFYWEVLDKKTKEPVQEGEAGELCFSHIDWRGTVFLRFNTGYFVNSLEWKKCPYCGLTLPILD